MSPSLPTTLDTVLRRYGGGGTMAAAFVLTVRNMPFHNYCIADSAAS